MRAWSFLALALVAVLLVPRPAVPAQNTWCVAAPPVPHAVPGPPEAHITIPTQGIAGAPVWSRPAQRAPDGSLHCTMVPKWGLTRYSGSVPFGAPGLTLVYGSDDEYGDIFRFIGGLPGPDPKTPIPFPGAEVQVTVRGRLLRYYVQRAITTSAVDLRWLQHPWHRPTLILLSCTPYQVDTERVYVIAQTR